MKRITLSLLAAAALCWSFNGKDTPIEQSAKRGKEVYQQNCTLCHGEDGEGIGGVYPPLAKADYLKDPRKSILAIIKGIKGPLKVNGVDYDAEMEAISLNDQQVADVMNFLYTNWGNKGRFIKPEEVRALR